VGTQKGNRFLQLTLTTEQRSGSKGSTRAGGGGSGYILMRGEAVKNFNLGFGRRESRNTDSR